MTINETVPAEMIESVDSHITVTGADDTGKTATGELIPQSRLLFFENAKSALAQATTINEVKSVRDKAIGLVAYAKKATDHGTRSRRRSDPPGSGAAAWPDDAKAEGDRRA